jgi:hypothetical protein
MQKSIRRWKNCGRTCWSSSGSRTNSESSGAWVAEPRSGQKRRLLHRGDHGIIALSSVPKKPRAVQEIRAMQLTRPKTAVAIVLIVVALTMAILVPPTCAGSWWCLLAQLAALRQDAGRAGCLARSARLAGASGSRPRAGGVQGSESFASSVADRYTGALKAARWAEIVRMASLVAHAAGHTTCWGEASSVTVTFYHPLLQKACQSERRRLRALESSQ